MSTKRIGESGTGSPRSLAATTAERLRERVFAKPAGELIGSLPDLARELQVGIVTIQQAARVLEHEGLLDVRRGPSGGYFGRRPDAGTLERALSAYMRMHPDSFDEALDMTSLLFTELCSAAARAAAAGHRAPLDALSERFAACASEDHVMALETTLQDMLFRMVDRPIFELLTRVTLRFAAMSGGPKLYRDAAGVRTWAAGRRRIVTAIRDGDEALARFEANRSNRDAVLGFLGAGRSGPA